MSSAAQSASATASSLLQSAVDSFTSASEINKQEYRGAPRAYNEEERLETVSRLGKLDWVSQEQYDAFTTIVCDIFNTPLSVMTVLHEDTQWFRAVKGLQDITETPRSISFCAWALLSKNTEVLLVPDASKDIRFFNNPAVTGPLQVASYVGCPMVLSTGQRLGNLCGFANDPLKTTQRQIQMLLNLTEVLVREFEREKIRECQQDADHFYNQCSEKLIRPAEVFEYGYLIVDVSNKNSQHWKLVLCTQQAAYLVGTETPHQKMQFLQEYVGSTWISVEDEKRVVNEERFSKSVKCLRHDGTQHWLQATFIPGHAAVLDQDTPKIQIPVDIPQGKQKQYYFIQLQTLSQPNNQLPSFLKQTWQLLSCEDGSVNMEQDGNNGNANNRSFNMQGSFIHRSQNKIVKRTIRNGQTVISKTLNMWDDPQNFDVVYSNLELQRKFNHPNLVQIIDVIPDKQKSMIQIVTEYCNAGSLLQIHDLVAFQNQDLNTIIQYCIQIVQGLYFLHSYVGICHGQLGPENVMLSSGEENNLVVKVCDAGQQIEMTSFRYQNVDRMEHNNKQISFELEDKAKQDDIEDLGRIFSFVFKACDSWISQDIKQQLSRIVQQCFEVGTLDTPRSSLEDVTLELQNLLS